VRHPSNYHAAWWHCRDRNRWLDGSVLREPTLDSFAEELSIYLSNPELVAQRGRNARQHVERNYSKTRHFTILRNVINRAAAEVNGYALP